MHFQFHSSFSVLRRVFLFITRKPVAIRKGYIPLSRECFHFVLSLSSGSFPPSQWAFIKFEFSTLDIFSEVMAVNIVVLCFFPSWQAAGATG